MPDNQQQLAGQQAAQVGQDLLQDAYNQGYRAHAALAENRHGVKVLEAMEKLQMELRAQGTTQHLRGFDGEGSEKFQTWLQDVERTLTQLGGDDARARALVLQTLTGPAADFATREIKKDDKITWKALKQKLIDRYSDLADMSYARQKLRRMVQAKSESVQNYYERILTTAKNAYGEDKLGDEHLQLQLVEHFIDGLTDDIMVKRLIRLKPKTLDLALEKATAEQQTQKVFNLRRGYTNTDHTPMEVDLVCSHNDELRQEVKELKESINLILQSLDNQHATPPQSAQIPSPPQPRDTQGRFVRYSSAYNQGNQRYPTGYNHGNRFRPPSSIECYNCHRRGHIAAQCWFRNRHSGMDNQRRYQNNGRYYGDAEVVSQGPDQQNYYLPKNE